MRPFPNKVFPFMMHFLMQEKKLFFPAMFSVVAIYIGITYMGYTLKVVVDTITAYDGTGDFWSLATPSLMTFAAIQSTIIIGYRISGFIFPMLGAKVGLKAQEDIFKYVTQHSYRYYQDNQTGAISNKMGTLYTMMRELIRTFCFTLFGVFVSFLTTTFILWTTAKSLLIVMWIYIILYCLLTVYTNKEKGRIKGGELSKTRNKVVSFLVDSITNIITIKSFGTEKLESKRQEKTHADFLLAFKDAVKFQEKERTIKAFLNFAFQFSAIILLAREFSLGNISLAEFVFIFTVINTLSRFSWEAADMIIGSMESIGQMQDALSLVLEDWEIEDKKDAQELQIKEGSLSFNKISFKYNKQKDIAINELNLHIKPGERIGVVGYSGAGKSTLVNLVLRFFDTTDGDILIDGQNIKEVTQSSLRQQIAYIPQEPMLFHRSIKENIAYAKPDATDAEIIEAAKKAEAHNFIENLPDGYDSMVGDRGIKLSGGQRQRIAIARAILKDAPILILDEATSALDSVTEKAIQSALEAVMTGRTTIAIAHRLSTLKHVDRILVLDKGSISEQGTHKELLKENKQYAKMWALQSDGFLPEEA